MQDRVRPRAVLRRAVLRRQPQLLPAGEALGGASHSICRGSGRLRLLLRRRLGQVLQVQGEEEEEGTRVLETDEMVGMSHTRKWISTHLKRGAFEFLGCEYHSCTEKCSSNSN